MSLVFVFPGAFAGVEEAVGLAVTFAGAFVDGAVAAVSTGTTLDGAGSTLGGAGAASTCGLCVLEGDAAIAGLFDGWFMISAPINNNTRTPATTPTATSGQEFERRRRTGALTASVLNDGDIAGGDIAAWVIGRGCVAMVVEGANELEISADEPSRDPRDETTRVTRSTYTRALSGAKGARATASSATSRKRCSRFRAKQRRITASNAGGRSGR